MTIARLASLAECSPALVSRIESGDASPSVATLVSLARALEVPAAALLAEEAPAWRAAAAVAAARTDVLLGRSPNLAPVVRASHDANVPPEWRARALALIATASPSGHDAMATAIEAESYLAGLGTRTSSRIGERARIEVSYALGEGAWVSGDWEAASRRWGNGLALDAPVGDIEALWARASIARALARAAPGTRTAANVLAIAIEALLPISDPATVAARLAGSPTEAISHEAPLMLAYVGAAQIALADARARRAALIEIPHVSGNSPRADLPIGRHLR
jgi:transcriptional regulator with XRE-family HTH domain